MQCAFRSWESSCDYVDLLNGRLWLIGHVGGHRAFHPLFVGRLQLKAEDIPGAGDVSQRIANVAGSGWLVVRIGCDVHFTGDEFQGAVDGDGAVRGEVHDLAGGFRDTSREDIALNDIADVGEAAGLLAVAVDDGAFAGEQGVNELGCDGGVGRIGVLPGAEDVEVAQADRLNVVELVEDGAELLAGEFGDGVWRERTGGELLLLWRDERIPVDGR